MQPQRINTIADLQAEQDRLQANMQITRKELVKSVAHTTGSTKDFLLKNVLLPAGAIGLGVFVAKQIADYQSSHRAEAPVLRTSGEAVRTRESEKGSGWFAKLMLVALPFLQQFFIKIKENDNAEGRQNGAGTMGVLATLVPIAVPMMQQFFIAKEEEAKEHIVTYGNNGSGGPQAEVTTPKHGAEAIFESLYKLLPVVLPLVQQFFASGNSQQPSPTPAQKQFSGNGQYAEAMG